MNKRSKEEKKGKRGGVSNLIFIRKSGLIPRRGSFLQKTEGELLKDPDIRFANPGNFIFSPPS
jgi:hypothetical protein